MAQGAVHEKLWTPANVVTLLRICLVPVFVVAIISPWPEYFPFWADAEASKPVSYTHLTLPTNREEAVAVDTVAHE